MVIEQDEKNSASHSSLNFEKKKNKQMHKKFI